MFFIFVSFLFCSKKGKKGTGECNCTGFSREEDVNPRGAYLAGGPGEGWPGLLLVAICSYHGLPRITTGYYRLIHHKT